jgi:LuxR family maltose regulon positive regulatory protein
MDEGQPKSNEVAPARRHIIDRPRLTRLLDQTEARVVMLVAPAGYGKTTLARQWLASVPHVFYSATSASADIAALTPGLVSAATRLTGATTAPLATRLKMTADPEHEVDGLIGLMVNAFARWPKDAWFAIDDYHLLMTSPAAESIVHSLSEAVGANLLVLTRQRPRWATARQLLYGEICELGRHNLAMDVEEADAVLGPTPRSASGLVALAEGWPAVIGLASLAEHSTTPEDIVDDALYNFFADELLHAAAPNARDELCRLAVAPSITKDLASRLFDDVYLEILGEAIRIGFIDPAGRDEWQLHPLLRTFLLMRFRELPRDEQNRTVDNVCEFLIQHRSWDHAFGVMDLFARHDILETLLSAALPEMLSRGRLKTLKDWLDWGERFSATPPVTRLVEAELAFRQGRHGDAEALAASATTDLPGSHPLLARGFFRAGQAAYFGERYPEALEYFAKCIASPSDRALEREARWTAFIAALDLERSDAPRYLEAFERIREPTIDDSVRMANARLITALRRGGVSEALALSKTATSIVDRASDPMIKTAFWNTYGWALALNARYNEAIRAATKERHEAEGAGLSFVVPHAQLLEALALVGLRDGRGAEPLLDDVMEFARERDDPFLRVNVEAVRARIFLLKGALRRAITATSSETPTSNTPGLYGEYLGIRAIALAASGDVVEARTTVDAIDDLTSQAEARSLAALAAVIALLVEGKDGDVATRTAIDLVSSLGQLDSLVTAYRAFPSLLIVASKAGQGAMLEGLVAASNDGALAYRHGLRTQAPKGQGDLLSRREQQVLDLVAAGRTNDEVARLLFISSVTVKTHLRHIYEKLGVRNRVEAAAFASKELPRESA